MTDKETVESSCSECCTRFIYKNSDKTDLSYDRQRSRNCCSLGHIQSTHANCDEYKESERPPLINKRIYTTKMAFITYIENDANVHYRYLISCTTKWIFDTQSYVIRMRRKASDLSRSPLQCMLQIGSSECEDRCNEQNNSLHELV